MNLGLLILVGLPGCGKTTLSKILKFNFCEHNEIKINFIHICYDELIQYVESQEMRLLRNVVADKIGNLVFAIKSKSYDLCPIEFSKEIENIQSSDSKVVLIVDDNMYFKSMRYSLYQLAKKYEIGFCQLYIKCSLDNALLKNQKRSSGMVPPDIIEAMYEKIEPPNNQNRWEKFSVTVEAFCTINELCDKLFPVLFESLEKHEHIRNENSKVRLISTLQCKKSVLHQVDLALRKIVREKVKEFTIKDISPKEFCMFIATRKAEILRDIKIGNITLPEEVVHEITQAEQDKCQLTNFLSTFF